MNEDGVVCESESPVASIGDGCRCMRGMARRFGITVWLLDILFARRPLEV